MLLMILIIFNVFRLADQLDWSNYVKHLDFIISLFTLGLRFLLPIYIYVALNWHLFLDFVDIFIKCVCFSSITSRVFSISIPKFDLVSNTTY